MLVATWESIAEKPRGTIRDRNAGRQLVDFRGLRWGKITPTDLDLSAHRVRCSVDMGGRAFAWVEFKHKGAEPTTGQWLHLAYLVSNSKAPAVAVVAEHEHQITEDIDAATALVRCHLSTFSRAWVQARHGLTVFECLDQFFSENAGGL
jgi:hypothetical protein